MGKLDSIQQAVAKSIAASAAWDEIEDRAEKVDEYRQYYDGNHPANLTDEMRRLLRTTRVGSEFTDNYAKRVVNARADRCIVNRIEADNDTATAWAEQVLDFNRFDSIQIDVHSSAFKDADTYVMVSFDNETKLPVFTHELAYDLDSGIIPIYKSTDTPELDCVIKIWHILAEDGKQANRTRINVYYPDRIEKFITGEDGLERFTEVQPDGSNNWPVAWVDSAGMPLGIPFVHFRNGKLKNWGISALEDVLGLQDALNRSLHSLVMAGELTAFQIIAAIGFNPPDSITPGEFLVIGKGGLSKDDLVDLKPIQAGDLSQLLALANWLKFELHSVSNTPLPEMVGTNISGEALKQHEIYLLGEIHRFMIKAGESWESVMKLANKIAATFGGEAPEFTRFYTKWNDPEIRNSQTVIDNANKVADKISDEEYLRIVGPIFDWDERKIEQILAEKQAAALQAVKMFSQNGPFTGDNPPPENASGAGVDMMNSGAG